MLDGEARVDANTALQRLDELLAEKARSHADLARALRCVIAVRNRLIEQARAGAAARADLQQVNSLLSLSFGAEFPLMGFHRERIEKVRDGLRKMLGAS
jgi:hypothetical protein